MYALKDIMRATLDQLGGSLYNSALTKFIYLMDLELIKQNGKQASDIEWVRDNFGPFVWDILNTALKFSELFRVEEAESGRRLIVLNDSESEREIPGALSDLVQKVSKEAPDPKLFFRGFRDYVYNTLPMVISDGHGPLDIIGAMKAESAADYVADTLMDTPEWDEALSYLATH